MSDKVRAAVLLAPGKIELRDFPYPKLEDDAFMLKMEMSGICGTDKHSYRGETKLYAGTETEADFRYPIIPGHENVGVVAEFGKNGRTDFYGEKLKVGDRVTMWPDIICGNCYYCRDEVGYGFPWCEHKENYGVTLSCVDPPHLFGGWSQYMYITGPTFVYKVPEALPLDMAILAELMSVFYGLDKVGDTVVVQGVGPLGLCQAIKARILGAGNIIVTDASQYKLDLALEFGADYALNINDTTSEERIRKVKELTGGHGADMVVECAGVPQAVVEGIEMLRRGGQYIEMGNYVEMGEVPMSAHKHLCTKAIRLTGISNHPYTGMGPAMKMMEKLQNRIDFSKVVSHRFKLDDVQEAMLTSMHPDSMKVVITPQ